MAEKKTKWKPMEGWKYWKVVSLNSMWFTITTSINDSYFDRAIIKEGNCFRTRREASAKCKKINRAIKQILSQ